MQVRSKPAAGTRTSIVVAIVVVVVVVVVVAIDVAAVVDDVDV